MPDLFYGKQYASGYYEQGQIVYSQNSEERRLRKRKRSYRDRVYGYREKWKVAFTFTSGLEEERSDPRKLMRAVHQYMKPKEIDYIIFLDVSPEGYWHAHGLSSDFFDMDTWQQEHQCSEDALYCELLYNPIGYGGRILDGLILYVNYMLRNIAKFPKGIHACIASYRAEKPITEIWDEDGCLLTVEQEPLSRVAEEAKTEESGESHGTIEVPASDDSTVKTAKVPCIKTAHQNNLPSIAKRGFGTVKGKIKNVLKNIIKIFKIISRFLE